ncbi:hypothetical protein [Marinoscillum furvescens]|uniref:hypothetical protein n=1 Tax=Marinoscillum furvescens TaxID=1026 RepID=UPI0011C04C57|nr:hypothetical protein [Marinoscillum furvescens]
MINKLKNYVTGQGARVEMAFGNPEINGPEALQVTLTAEATDDVLYAEQVILQLRAIERSASSHVLYSDDLVLDKQVQLSPGQPSKWEQSVAIPPHIAGTFVGKHSSFHWEVRGRLEAAGIDPKSEWQKFFVNRIPTTEH